LDNPVDPSMSKSLFREEDPLLRFYEDKYKFEVKDIRPFAQHTATWENNPLHNEQVFIKEVELVRKAEEEEKKQ